MNNKDDNLLYKLLEITLILIFELLYKIGTTTTNIFYKIFGGPIRLVKSTYGKIKRLLKRVTR